MTSAGLQNTDPKPAMAEGSRDVRLKARKSVKGDAIMCDLSEQDHNVFLAISFGKIHRVAASLPEVDNINMRNHDMQTLLIHATHSTSGNLCSQLVRMLIQANSDINVQDVYGRTALMYACADRHNDDAVRHLIRQPSCDPNLVDCEGNTALMFAVAADAVTAVHILLKHRKVRHKLNVNIANSKGLTALDMAISLKSEECCKVLVDQAGHKITTINDEEGLSALLGTNGMASESSV
ncbi:ankyrin repeat domain-containing protein 7-like [Haliotis asinina]|uniref:ankyrin repeat domain-containing protein 7-like n=1 Tax=Haliotis asinina TaxID=109174 RepID=UPI00353245AC